MSKVIIENGELKYRSCRKHVFQYEGADRAKELLKQMQEANPAMAVGYTEANKALFEKI